MNKMRGLKIRNSKVLLCTGRTKLFLIRLYRMLKITSLTFNFGNVYYYKMGIYVMIKSCLLVEKCFSEQNKVKI